MNHFIVTFRFKDDEDYSKRYQSFVDKIHEIAESYEWDETSSFFTFKASGTAQGVCNNLYVHTDFNASKDLMVVIDLDNKAWASKGELKYESLLKRGLGF